MKHSVTLLLLMLGALFLLPVTAQAQVMGVDLNGLGNVCAKAGSIFASRAGDPTSAELCEATKDTLFAHLFCILETTLGMIIATTFCAIRDAWLQPFAAMMLLLMAVTGVSFATGMLRFTVKEVAVIIFKMALVTMFVTNASLAMDVAYAFYIGLMKGIVNIMMNGFGNLKVTDGGLQTAQEAMDAVQKTVSGGNAFSEIDGQYQGMADELFNIQKNKNNGSICSVFTFVLGLVLTLPFAAGIVMFAIIAFMGFFARAAYGYIYALVMTTFLIAAMPIFVSFALFRSTADLFEHWLKYIGSNVVQIFIVFAIMAFASTIDFMGFLRQLDSIIVDYTFKFGPQGFGGLFSFNFNFCSICNPNFTANRFGIPMLDPAQPCVGGDQTPLDGFALRENVQFFYFIMMNGISLYLITIVMDEFMKQGPDIAKSLSGTRMVQTIGGISAMGQAYNDTALHRGTASFEQGTKKAWDADDAEGLAGNSASRAGRALKGGTEEATQGAYREGNEKANEIRKQVIEENEEYSELLEEADERLITEQNKMNDLVVRREKSEVTFEEIFEQSQKVNQARREVKNINLQIDSAMNKLIERGDEAGQNKRDLAEGNPGPSKGSLGGWFGQDEAEMRAEEKQKGDFGSEG